MSRRTALTCVLLLSSVALSVAFHVSVLPGRTTVQDQALTMCPSLRATPARGNRVSTVTMGMRDKIKGTLAALGAAFTIGMAPPPASAADAPTAEPATTEEVQEQRPATPQPMILPSQVAHYRRMTEGSSNPYIAKVKKVTKDPRLYYVIGGAAAAGAGYVVVTNMNKQRNEQFRKMIAEKSNINIDASILDETRINRPGAKTVQFTNAPKFGSYRPPPEKLMKDVKDKYKWDRGEKKDAEKEEEDLAAKIQLDIFKKAAQAKKNGDIPNTNGDILKKKSDLDADSATVEIVDDNDGPRTAAQKALEDELNSLGMDGMDEVMRAAMSGDPTAQMDPAMMAAALPALQEQLAELMKGGITKEEVQEVKQSFSDMGIDLDDMFRKIDEMERAGLSDAVGPEGTEFFRTLKSIIDTA